MGLLQLIQQYFHKKGVKEILLEGLSFPKRKGTLEETAETAYKDSPDITASTDNDKQQWALQQFDSVRPSTINALVGLFTPDDPSQYAIYQRLALALAPVLDVYCMTDVDAKQLALAMRDSRPTDAVVMYTESFVDLIDLTAKLVAWYQKEQSRSSSEDALQQVSHCKDALALPGKHWPYAAKREYISRLLPHMESKQDNEIDRWVNDVTFGKRHAKRLSATQVYDIADLLLSQPADKVEEVRRNVQAAIQCGCNYEETIAYTALLDRLGSKPKKRSLTSAIVEGGMANGGLSYAVATQMAEDACGMLVDTPIENILKWADRYVHALRVRCNAADAKSLADQWLQEHITLDHEQAHDGYNAMLLALVNRASYADARLFREYVLSRPDTHGSITHNQPHLFIEATLLAFRNGCAYEEAKPLAEAYEVDMRMINGRAGLLYELTLKAMRDGQSFDVARETAEASYASAARNALFTAGVIQAVDARAERFILPALPKTTCNGSSHQSELDPFIIPDNKNGKVVL